MTRPRTGDWIRGNALGLVALFFALTMGTAWATHPGGANTISSADIINGEVKNGDLAADSVGSGKIIDRQVKNADLSIGASSSNTIADGGIQGIDVKNATLTGTHIANNSLSGDDIDESTLAGLWFTGGNAATNPATDSLGTTDDVPLNFRVNNQRALRLEPHATSPNLVGGHAANDVTAGAFAATISGGGQEALENRVTDDYGTVGGGLGNLAGDDTGTTSDRRIATVAGGGGNDARGQGSAIAGGLNNAAGGSSSTVAGGLNNAASGEASAVAGGSSNIAAGDRSLVAGTDANNANDAHDGVFLFADSTGFDKFSSLSANEFAVRASGGVRLRTAADESTGCNLPAGSGTFVCTSDRNSKQGFEEVDSGTVLSRLAELPITTWSFKSDPTGTRHIGPVAQDFHAAFGLGSDDETISSVDADGVALAAIKGLHRKLRAERRHRIENEGRIARLEARLSALAREGR
jgi:hypothetical protein